MLVWIDLVVWVIVAFGLGACIAGLFVWMFVLGYCWLVMLWRLLIVLGMAATHSLFVRYCFGCF